MGATVLALSGTATAVALTVPDDPAPAGVAPAAVDGPGVNVKLGSHTAWQGTHGGEDVVLVTNPAARGEASATRQPVLGYGCLAPTGGQVIRLCGGHQDPGTPSIFVGRVTPGVATVEAAFASGGTGTVDRAGDLFIVTGPAPGSATTDGEPPAKVTAKDAQGRVIGTFGSGLTGA